MTYYNEWEPYAAEWLRNLIWAGLIPDGDVDERSIKEVTAKDVAGYTQCHFFAGIGGWPLALRLAGWPDDRPVWTGSCPCQPFSVAGEGNGINDDRHLLPYFADLAIESKAPIIFGEQVRGAIPHGWLDDLCACFEQNSYACGALVFPGFLVGARHERKRLYWVADSDSARWEGSEHDNCISSATGQAYAVDRNPLLAAGRALDGDFDDLLSSNGLSVQLERSALKCYGNAIIPQAAAEFIRMVM